MTIDLRVTQWSAVLVAVDVVIAEQSIEAEGLAWLRKAAEAIRTEARRRGPTDMLSMSIDHPGCEMLAYIVQQRARVYPQHPTLGVISDELRRQIDRQASAG